MYIVYVKLPELSTHVEKIRKTRDEANTHLYVDGTVLDLYTAFSLY